MISFYLSILLAALLQFNLCFYQAPPYAEWAHSHVIWLNGKEQNQSEIYSLLKTYQSYNIPVGGVNIDSDWSTCFNNFQFNRKKFPNPEKLVANFHAQGVKVILWATSVVNKECDIYKEGIQNGYFLNNGKVMHWWHGNGAFVDFFNPKAKDWWFKLMDKVLDMGFDGWKCDGTDPMIVLLRPWPYSKHLKRYVGIHEYSHQYYGSFYNHTKSKNKDALIMSRPVDSFQNHVYLSYSPKYVMFAGWVGDQDSDNNGFKDAMANVIHSASKGYLSFGFDIGGYRGSKDQNKNTFLRWAQTGALMPFMENGGNGKHQPWRWDQETVDIYRKFVLLHYDLKDFFLTAGTEAYQKHVSILEPIIKDKRTVQLQVPQNLGYILWKTFLVSPIFEDNGMADIIFPKGSNWIYYFNRSQIYKGATKVSLAFKLDETPFYIKSNSVFPFKGELWIVYLEEGVYEKTIITGDYTDIFNIEYVNLVLKIQVKRYYKDDQVKAKRASDSNIRIRAIGVESIKLITEQPVEQTEYPNEFYFNLQLNTNISLHLKTQQNYV